MKTRVTRVRSKIAALLVSLAALWAFAAYVTVEAGLNLLWINTLDQNVGRPTDALVTALQTERRVSAQYLGGGREDPRRQLEQARLATDSARAALQASSSLTSVRWAADDAFEQRLDALLVNLDVLEPTRRTVDSGTPGDRASVASEFTGIIDAAFHLYDKLGQYASEIADDGATVVGLSRAREKLAQEDAMLSGILRAGAFADREPFTFASLVGVQRAFYAEAVARVAPADRTAYEAVVDSATFKRMQSLEDQAIAQARVGGAPPFTLNTWRDSIEPVLDQLRGVEQSLADTVLQRATPAATAIIVRLALAGGLGLIAVIASIVVAITTSRRLLRQLEQLRTSAEELAAYRLPRVVERLQHGERVDIAAEAPPLNFGRDEVGRVGEAFNTVQETAIRVAVEQAELRRSIRDVFLSLARRSQALLHRQLSLLDAMERRASDPEELSELFRVDHLATRMRRNAENLIVLSGATAGRAWRRPVPMIDVIRGALAEVEDYTRVTVVPTGNVSLIGRAVGDVIHLLAELIENAVSFSPPQTVVRISGTVVGNGFAIEIEDRGLGMTEDELEAANEQLRNPPEFVLTSTARLGHYVVAKLAERHGIRVRLSPSSFGGTTAVVLLPATLMADDALLSTSSGAAQIDAGDLDGARPSQLASIPTGAFGADAGFSMETAPPRGPLTPPPASASPARRTEQPLTTPSGLPWRQRPGAKDDRAGSATVESPIDRTGESPIRRPEGIRPQFASYRGGTHRSRDEASRSTQPELEGPQSTEGEETR